MSAPLTLLSCALTVAVLAPFGFAPFAALGRAQDKQDKSLAEIAAEAKRKKQESARPVLTNDELGTAAPALPAVRVLRRSEHIPALAPFVPTPMPTVEAMLELASVREGEVVFDVGSGDGRIVIAAAELLGARAVGIEVDEALVARSRKTVEEKGLAERVRIIHANALDVDLSPADVVTLYLTPDGLKVLRPHLEKTLRPGTRVVSHDFQILGWELAERRRVDGKEIYLYRVP